MKPIYYVDAPHLVDIHFSPDEGNVVDALDGVIFDLVAAESTKDSTDASKIPDDVKTKLFQISAGLNSGEDVIEAVDVRHIRAIAQEASRTAYTGKSSEQMFLKAGLAQDLDLIGQNLAPPPNYSVDEAEIDRQVAEFANSLNRQLN